MAEETNSYSVQKDQADGSIIVSGATKHITKDLGHLSPGEETAPITVHLADIMTVTTKQQGSVKLKLFTHHRGITKTNFVLITKVLYIPEPAVNLWSCSELDRSRISTRFDNGLC